MMSTPHASVYLRPSPPLWAIRPKLTTSFLHQPLKNIPGRRRLCCTGTLPFLLRKYQRIALRPRLHPEPHRAHSSPSPGSSNLRAGISLSRLPTPIPPAEARGIIVETSPALRSSGSSHQHIRCCPPKRFRASPRPLLGFRGRRVGRSLILPTSSIDRGGNARDHTGVDFFTAPSDSTHGSLVLPTARGMMEWRG